MNRIMGGGEWLELTRDVAQVKSHVCRSQAIRLLR